MTPMRLERERAERRTALRSAAITAAALVLTVVATNGVGPSETPSTPPVELSFIAR